MFTIIPIIGNESALLPTVTSSAGSYNSTTEEVTMNGNVTDDGGATITERGFYYDINDPSIDNTNTKRVVSGTTGAFSTSVFVIPNGSNSMYYRAYAVNSAGEELSSSTQSVTTI